MTIPDALLLLFVSFAAYRATRLWIYDDITEGLRDSVARLLTRKPTRFKLWLYDLQSCPWCLGVWVSAALWGMAVGVGLAGRDDAPWWTQGALVLIGTLACAALQSWWLLVEVRLGSDPDEEDDVEDVG